jgi:hypothetical protein
MSRGVSHVGQGFAGLGADANLEVFAEGNDSFEAVVTAFAGHQHVVKAALTCFESLFHRMESVENLHSL